ncbi:MAG: zinc-dependent alcohol dehydrogenase family protein [Lautropia sp.]
MKRVLLDSYGNPPQGLRCAEVPDLPEPLGDQVLFDVRFFPINPADINFCQGTYRLRPDLPATPGAECVGFVRAVGPSVTRFAPGDRVINLQRENWAQARLVREADLVPVPAGIDDEQAAMLRINPPTASLLLSDVVTLAPGDWIVQNVANSSVGRWIVRLARRRGLRTVNVVRRESLRPMLEALGADACVVDGPNLGARVRAAAGGVAPALGIDAIGGAASIRIADAIRDGGTLACYGAMSGEPPALTYANLLFRDVAVRGFVLGNFLARRSTAAVAALYGELASMLVDGDLRVPVEWIYPIDEITAAVGHAMRGERSGKILVAANG